VRDGAAAVVAVGGDGTLHEVLLNEPTVVSYALIVCVR
jgi:diacylglycerol kinase family enzyme